MMNCINCKSKSIKQSEIQGLTKTDILIKYLCEKCGHFTFREKK